MDKKIILFSIFLTLALSGISDGLTLFRVQFRFKPPAGAESVYLAGTFNNWSTNADKMEKVNSEYIIEKLLPQGEYQYKFVVNGTDWYQDPNNPDAVPDGFGGFNSVIRVSPKTYPSVEFKRGDGIISVNALLHDPKKLHFSNYVDGILTSRLRLIQDDVDSVVISVSSQDTTFSQKLDLQQSQIPYEEAVGSFAIPSDSFTYIFRIYDGKSGLVYPDQPISWTLSNALIFEVPKWVQGAIIYQIFPERFFNGDTLNDPPGTKPWLYEKLEPPQGWFAFYGGDLWGIIEKLDYLVDLGVDAIYLNPIFESPSNHGYDIVDYFHVAKKFGGDIAFDSLLSSAHRKNIKIILDGVFNHSSDKHPYFQDVRARGPESPYFNWYHIKKWPFPVSFNGEKAIDYYECWWGFSSLPEWNFSNSSVRDYLMKAALYWTEKGIDGWRLDVPNEVPHNFWKYFREKIKEFNPEVYIVGEIWGDGTPWLQGDEFDAVMNYRMRNLILNFVMGKLSTKEFRSGIQRIYGDYPQQVHNVLFNLLGSHDTPRVLQILSGDTTLLKIAVFLQMTLPGAPVIYYGDEIGMLGDGDPDDRRVFIWNKNAWNQPVYNFYRKIIALRKSFPSLRYGNMAFVETQQILAFSRTYKGVTTLQLVNPLPFRISEEINLKSDKKILGVIGNLSASVEGTKLDVSLPSFGFGIISLK